MAQETFYINTEGRPAPSVQFDATFIPTSSQKDALPGPSGYTPGSSDVYATVNYVLDKIKETEWWKSVEHSISYLKTTAGAPSGAATNGEKCLNTNEDKLYTFTTGSWDAGVAVTSAMRFIFKDTGDDTTGNSGTFTHDNVVREYNGSTYDTYSPTLGTALAVDDEGTNGTNYRYNGTSWIKWTSSTEHNLLAGIDGGGTYHITQAQEAGIAAATAITSTNPPVTKSDKDQLPVKYVFTWRGGFPVSQTDKEIWEASGALQRIIMPAGGSIVKATLSSTANCSAGTLDAEPSINGTKATGNGLDLQLNTTTTNDDKAEVAIDTTGLTFSTGDGLGSMWSSSADWAPTNSTVEHTFYVVFNT